MGGKEIYSLERLENIKNAMNQRIRNLTTKVSVMEKDKSDFPILSLKNSYA